MAESRSFGEIMELDDRQEFLLGRAMALADAIVGLADSGDGTGNSRLAVRFLGPFLHDPAGHYETVGRAAEEHLGAARRRNPALADALHEALESVRARITTPITPITSDEMSASITAGWDQQHYRVITKRLQVAQEERDRAMEYAKAWAREMHAAGMPEAQIAEKLGINRQTVRAALGK